MLQTCFLGQASPFLRQAQSHQKNLIKGKKDVTSGPILLEDGGASHCHGVMQVLPQNALVEVQVHPGIPREDVELAQLPIADGTPDHEFGWVLHGGPQELGLVGVQGRAPPHTAVDPSATSPLLLFLLLLFSSGSLHFWRFPLFFPSGV